MDGIDAGCVADIGEGCWIVLTQSAGGQNKERDPNRTRVDTITLTNVQRQFHGVTKKSLDSCWFLPQQSRNRSIPGLLKFRRPIDRRGYPLMPVSAIPRTKSRCPKKKTISTGISTISATAIM